MTQTPLPRFLAAGAVLILLSAPPAGAQTSATFELIGPPEQNVLSGSEIQITVAATFNETLAAATFEIASDQDGRALVLSRSVNDDLSFISTDPDDPFDHGLPAPLSPADPLVDVVMGLQKAFAPGEPADGAPQGSQVVLETLTLRLSGRGPLAISVTAPDAAETQSNQDGALFSNVALLPGADILTFNMAINADFDADGDIDISDFAHLQVCSATTAHDPPTPCADCDLDGDGDVDASDNQLFGSCMSGPAASGYPECTGQF